MYLDFFFRKKEKHLKQRKEREEIEKLQIKWLALYCCNKLVYSFHEVFVRFFLNSLLWCEVVVLVLVVEVAFCTLVFRLIAPFLLNFSLLTFSLGPIISSLQALMINIFASHSEELQIIPSLLLDWREY